MNDRILVKLYAGEYCIGFRTISRRRKSSQKFLITRERLEALETTDSIITCDIHSFAVLRRDEARNMVTIEFTWLSGITNRLTGWEETVTIPYDALKDFLKSSADENGPETWNVLSVRKSSLPKIVFRNKSRLRECLENRTVRKKLAHALRDNFKYPNVDQIILGGDSQRYSFLFQEMRDGKPGICGGLIFHNYQDDLKKAYYSVHT